jgi:hypothetical protein
MTGPTSATNSDVASFNGTTGQILQDSGKALPTGAIVGTTDTQTLTGKSIAGSEINSGLVGATYGGTGVNNGSNTITLGASLTTTGAGAPTLAFPSSSFTYTLPSSSGTLAELGLAQTFSAAQTFGEVLGTVTTQSGTTYTFANADCGTEVVFSNASAVTATIPTTLPAGCNISVLQSGAGQVAVNGSAVTPATLHSAHSYTKTFGQWSVIGVNIEASGVAILTGDGA